METVGTTLVSLAEREPNILLNRTIGLDVEAPEQPGTVEAMAQRIRDAVDGDPQHSYHNILRMNFQPTDLCENYSGFMANTSDPTASIETITP